MSNPARKCVRLLISGRVQGVGFRNWTQKKAQKLGISGWVRNLASGEVEALLCGEAAALQHMIDACHKGPLTAKVSVVQIIAAEAEQAMQGFIRLPNA